MARAGIRHPRDVAGRGGAERPAADVHGNNALLEVGQPLCVLRHRPGGHGCQHFFGSVAAQGVSIRGATLTRVVAGRAVAGERVNTGVGVLRMCHILHRRWHLCLQQPDCSNQNSGLRDSGDRQTHGAPSNGRRPPAATGRNGGDHGKSADQQHEHVFCASAVMTWNREDQKAVIMPGSRWVKPYNAPLPVLVLADSVLRTRVTKARNRGVYGGRSFPDDALRCPRDGGCALVRHGVRTGAEAGRAGRWHAAHWIRGAADSSRGGDRRGQPDRGRRTSVRDQNSADATIVDTSGRTMLPGLIETHGHLVVLGHGSYDTWFPWIAKHGGDAMLTRVMEISARQLLMAGVTTTVDLGAPLKPILAIRDRINKGDVVGSRMLVSGPWIARLGAAAGAARCRSASAASTSPTPQEAERETERARDGGRRRHQGARGPDRSTTTRPSSTRRTGTASKVYAHVYAEPDVRHALDAGVDVLQHVGSAGTAPPYSNDSSPTSSTPAARSSSRPRTARGCTKTPRRFPNGCRIPDLKKAFGPDIYAEVQDSLKNWWALGYFQRTDREMLFRERGVKQFIESGAVMGMGTDSGTPMNFHSEALWREIKVHVDMGMTPSRAIAAATRVNAQIIGKARELGSIEPGKIADIIVVNGNPLFDITALSHVEIVMKDGVVYKGGPSAAAQPRTGNVGQ